MVSDRNPAGRHSPLAIVADVTVPHGQSPLALTFNGHERTGTFQSRPPGTIAVAFSSFLRYKSCTSGPIVLSLRRTERQIPSSGHRTKSPRALAFPTKPIAAAACQAVLFSGPEFGHAFLRNGINAQSLAGIRFRGGPAGVIAVPVR